MYANLADLQTFLKLHRPDLPSTTNFSFQSIDGGQNLQNLSEAGLEASLDIQYTVGLASGVPVTIVAVPPTVSAVDTNFTANLIDELNYLLSLDKPPYVITTSYAYDEVNLTLPMAQCVTHMNATA